MWDLKVGISGSSTRLKFEIAFHRYGFSCGMAGHFVKELNKFRELICGLDCSGILRKNLFRQCFEFVSPGKSKQFFLGLIGKFHEKSFFKVVSKACLLKSEK